MRRTSCPRPTKASASRAKKGEEGPCRKRMTRLACPCMQTTMLLPAARRLWQSRNAKLKGGRQRCAGSGIGLEAGSANQHFAQLQGNGVSPAQWTGNANRIAARRRGAIVRHLAEEAHHVFRFARPQCEGVNVAGIEDQSDGNEF